VSAVVGLKELKSCGECSLCCRVLNAPEIGKPDDEWCQYYKAGVGCSIHKTRPKLCRDFQCQWTRTGHLGEEWRPDRCHFVLWTQYEDQLIVEVDPLHPEAWRAEPYHASLQQFAKQVQVLVRIKTHMFAVFPEADIDMGVQQTDKDIDWGYALNFQGKRVPYARFVERRPQP
jgi:hypothetical protein